MVTKTEKRRIEKERAGTLTSTLIDFAKSKGYSTYEDYILQRSKATEERRETRLEEKGPISTPTNYYIGKEGVKQAEKDVAAANKAAPAKTITPTRAPTITLRPKEEEKTGISKLREEDSIIGAAVRIATDWRTTVALVATVATLGSLGGLIAGASAARTVGTGVITRTATRFGATKAASITTQRAITGITGKSGVNKLFQAGITLRKGITPAVNKKTHALTTSMLTKAGFTIGAAGAWTSAIFLGKWGQAEAGEPISIAMRDALKQAQETGDWSIYEDAREVRDELLNLEAWEKVAMWSPFAPFIGIPNKIKGVIEGSKVLDKVAERARQKQEEEKDKPTFAEEREASDIEARERKMKWRGEDEEYYKEQREETAEREEEERGEEEDYYKRITKERQERELREREEESEYYKKIAEENKQRKEEERTADEAYWDEIYKKNEKKKEGDEKTTYEYWKKKKKEKTDEPWNAKDKKIVDDWNAGKSALNFGWLFL